MFIEFIQAIALEVNYQLDRACINRRWVEEAADTLDNRALWRAGRL